MSFQVERQDEKSGRRNAEAREPSARVSQAPGQSLSAAHPLLRLQRAIGNRAVGGWLERTPSAEAGARPYLQRQLTVGAASDPLEEEADRVSRQVMSVSPSRETSPELIERSPQSQKLPAEEELHRQTEATAPSAHESFLAGEEVEQALRRTSGGGTALPTPVRSFMEPRLGADLGAVRVHADENSAQLNAAVAARAFTHGRDVYFGAGESPGNLGLMAHELTHVVQQGAAPPLAATEADERTDAR